MAQSSKEEKQKMKIALKLRKSLEKEMDDHNLRSSSPESEDVDFKKVIHPLSYYIHDREQMIEEMFSIIKGEKLRKMLPSLLRNYSLEELKADCLVHLLGMSRKRIMAILEGRELNSSSNSETESSDTISSDSDEAVESPKDKLDSKLNVDEEDLLDISVSKQDIDSLMKDKPKVSNHSLKKSKVRIKKKIKPDKDAALCSIIISDDDADDASDKKTKKRNRERDSSKSNKVLVKKQKSKKLKKIKEHSKNNADRSTSESSDDTRQNTLGDGKTVLREKKEKGKTLLEILELEMRARAIRALLKNTPDSEDFAAVSSNLKSETACKPKTDPKISDAIVEAIDQTLSEKICPLVSNNNISESGNDVEIIDISDVDLCVTIDDDDEIITAASHSKDTTTKISAEPSSEPAKEGKAEMCESSTHANAKKCDPAKKNQSNVYEPPQESDSTKCELSVENESEKSAGESIISKDDATWLERWAQNKNVKDVVRNSKICASIRKRMRFARMLKQKQSEGSNEKKQEELDLGNVDERSVAHFNLLKEYYSKNENSVSGDSVNVGEDNAVV